MKAKKGKLNVILINSFDPAGKLSCSSYTVYLFSVNFSK